MTYKQILRWDSITKTFRLFRLISKDGHTKLSFALRPAFFYHIKEYDGWIINILGLRIHKRVSFGGGYV